MASGCIVTYRGKRGDVFRMKFTDADGRQRMETIGPARSKSNPGGLTRREAEKQLQARLVAIRERRWRAPAPLTFEQYARTWFAQCETRRAWKIATVVAYSTVLDRLIEAFGPSKLSEIRPRHVAAYIKRRGDEGWAPATVNRDVSVLHDIFKVAVREELIDANPAAAAERPRVRQKRFRILKPAEVARVARAFKDDQARVIFLVLVLTGLRRFELQALRWRDVDLVENVLRVVDSKSEEGVRAIAIPPGLAEALWQHRRASNFQGDDELVFCHQARGSKIDAEWFAVKFRDALAEAGIVEHMRPFHDLRHTAITNDAAAGSSPLAVMAKAGHASMQTTKRYLHLAGTVFRDEAALLEQRYGLSLSTDPDTAPADAERHETSAEALNAA